MSKATVVASLVSAIGGAVIGGGITYLVVKKYYQEYARTEIEETKRYYALVRKGKDELAIFGEMDEESLAEEAVEAETVEEEPVEIPANLPNGFSPEAYSKAKKLVNQLGYQSVDTRDVFSQAVPESEVGPELSGPNGHPINVPDVDPIDPNDPLQALGYIRYSGQPYIITMDEFFEDETSWDKVSLSFYEGDETLIDERDKVIDNIDTYVGNRHLDMFGVLSKDKNVVYVRNERISTDFEIIREKGKYSVRVLGMPEEDTRGKAPLRMRDSD